MFLQFSRINNNDPGQLSDIVVAWQDIKTVGVDIVENKKTQTIYNATRVEVNAFPNYSFHTLSTPDQFRSVPSVYVVDVPYQPEQDYVTGGCWYPMINVPVLVNNSKHLVQNLIINSQFLVFSETITYIDQQLGQQQCLLIVLRDAQPKRIYANMAFTELTAILEPDVVPT